MDLFTAFSLEFPGLARVQVPQPFQPGPWRLRVLPVVPAHQRCEVPLRFLPLLPALLLAGGLLLGHLHLTEEQPRHGCLCGLSSHRGCLRLCSPSFCSSLGPAPAFSAIFSSKPGRQLFGAALAPGLLYFLTQVPSQDIQGRLSPALGPGRLQWLRPSSWSETSLQGPVSLALQSSPLCFLLFFLPFLGA